MKKYKIGLIVLSVIVAFLTIFILIAGFGARQDVKTEKVANEIGTKIDTYINKNNTVPPNLSTAGVKDVPSTIVYTKLGETKFKVCVTYKAAKGYGTGGGITNLMYSGIYGGMSPSSYPTDDSTYEQSTYYPDYTHKKGESCQTVKPYISSYMDDSSSYNSSGDAEYCSPGGRYYDSYKKYCANGKLDFSTPQTTVN